MWWWLKFIPNTKQAALNLCDQKGHNFVIFRLKKAFVQKFGHEKAAGNVNSASCYKMKHKFDWAQNRNPQDSSISFMTL